MKETRTNRLENPIIFIGTGRSGSTFISGAVLSHIKLGYPSNYQNRFPKNLSINLIKNLYDNKLWRIYTRGNKNSIYHRSLFLPSEAYDMWKHITNENTDFSRDFLYQKKASGEEIKRVRLFFDKMLILQNKDRLAFKITGPGRIGFLLSIFPDAQFVWVKRRIIPTVSSFMKRRFWEKRGKSNLWFKGVYSNKDKEYVNGLINHPAELTAFQLGKIISTIEKEIQNLNPAILAVEYEDFLNSPDEKIDEILDFLDLEKDKACYNYVKYNKVSSRQKKDNDYYTEQEIDFIMKAFHTGLGNV